MATPRTPVGTGRAADPLPARPPAELPEARPQADSRPYPDDRADACAPSSVPLLSRVPGFILALSGLALTSGTIHLVATIEHLDVNVPLSAFFALVGVGQVGAAWWIFRRPNDERMLKRIALGSVIVSLLWVLSRTTGIPFGPEPGRAAVGVADTITTLQQLVLAAIIVALLRRPERGHQRLPWLSSPLGTRIMPALLTMTMLIAAMGGHEH